MTKSNILLWSAVLLILALLEGLNVQVAIILYLTWLVSLLGVLSLCKGEL